MKNFSENSNAHPFYSRVDQMTPFRPDFDRPRFEAIQEKAAIVLCKSSELSGHVRGLSALSLERLSIAMSCYYTNMMEGSVTTPADIEEALHSMEQSRPRMNLPELTRAHIDASLWSKKAPLIKAPQGLASWIKEAHAKIYTSDLQGERGKIRESQVSVGEHLAVDYKAIPAFLDKLQNVYVSTASTGKLAGVIDALCLHHRLMWVHPFADGNGRVGRLLLQHMLEQSIPGGGLWSVSRGFARDNNGASYKGALHNADMPRNGDTDGRGNLSNVQLAAFVDFSLDCCLDQIEFMSRSFDMDSFNQRVLFTFGLLFGPDKAPSISSMYSHCMTKGQATRGEALAISGIPERTARNHLKDLLNLGFLKTVSDKGALFAAFPVPALGHLLPNMYPTAALPALSKENLSNQTDQDALTRIQSVIQP